MDIAVTRDVIAAMERAASAALPQEACGILFESEGRIDGFRETRNVHVQPCSHFEIDPRALIDAHRAQRCGGPVIAGYFHSHPSGPPEPSPTDRAMAQSDGSIWAIAGNGQLRFWRAVDGSFTALCTAPFDG